MDGLVEKLEGFSLEKLINAYSHELCVKTLNQTKIASFLNFNFDEIAIIDAPPDNFSKNGKLYEYIQKKSEVRNFLEALQDTGNEHILKFIKETDFSASDQLPSTSAGANQSRGIWFNIPEPIESFYGRENFLSQLHDQLKPRDGSETEVTVLSQVKIVSGLGGIGKTETARRYIMKCGKFYKNFIWINAENENSMRSSFTQLAEELKVPVKNSQGKSREIEEIVKEIYTKICECGKPLSNSNLILFDNAEDYQSCKKFFPFGLHPHLKKPVILATSRNQEWMSPTGKIQVLPLDVLTKSESLEFILRELEIPESESESDTDTEEFTSESKELIDLLGGLPLALQQAVAFIRQEKEHRELGGTAYKISDYVQEFKLSMEKFLSFPPASGLSPTVFVTWNVTFAKIQSLENGEEAIKILEILSFLYADKIPSSFLQDVVPEIPSREFSTALKLLKKYSMIKINPKDFCLSIHRQLQLVILQYLEKCNDISNVVSNLVEKYTGILENVKLPKSSDIFLNIHQIVNDPFNLILIPTTEGFLDFMDKFATCLYEASRYVESLQVFQNIHRKGIQLYGENHEKTLESQHQVAAQLYKLGKYEESLALYKETVEKMEIHWGMEHPQTINTRHNIAVVLQSQRKYKESLELLEQVLVQRKKVQGESHRLTTDPHHSECDCCAS